MGCQDPESLEHRARTHDVVCSARATIDAVEVRVNEDGRHSFTRGARGARGALEAGDDVGYTRIRRRQAPEKRRVFECAGPRPLHENLDGRDGCDLVELAFDIVRRQHFICVRAYRAWAHCNKRKDMANRKRPTEAYRGVSHRPPRPRCVLQRDEDKEQSYAFCKATPGRYAHLQGGMFSAI